MRSFHARCVVLTLGLAGLAGGARAQDGGAPALFPIPAPVVYPNYAVAQTAAKDSLWYDAEPSPSVNQLPSPAEKPADQSVVAPDYQGAMSGNWDSCTSGVGGTASCEGGCGHNHYLYANALVMTAIKGGGLVASIDSNTGDPALSSGSAEFGNLWHGGVEVGGGWCFASGGISGMEVVYWGLFVSPGTVTATGTVDSLIDFSDLDYNGATGDTYFAGAAAQRLTFDQDFNSVEVNLLGNYGGPLGCGRCGCCSTNCGSRLGYGWLAGFRYINFTENWLLSTEQDDTVFDNDADQLNYSVDLKNNLFGFQMGTGLNYCLSERLQAYAIAKVGVYGNNIQMRQRIYGSAGTATLNSGSQSGSNYDISASDVGLAVAGQMDIGGRYIIDPNWSVDFGYRVLGLSGVALSEDNVAQGSFQNVSGISDIQTSGSLLLHGGYVGVTYCW